MSLPDYIGGLFSAFVHMYTFSMDPALCFINEALGSSCSGNHGCKMSKVGQRRLQDSEHYSVFLGEGKLWQTWQFATSIQI